MIGISGYAIKKKLIKMCREMYKVYNNFRWPLNYLIHTPYS
jgi:hypothetical protein